jgi:hypothetical protein
MSHFVLTALIVAGAILAVAALRFALRATLILAALAAEGVGPRVRPLAEIIPFPLARLASDSEPRAAA